MPEEVEVTPSPQRPTAAAKRQRDSRIAVRAFDLSTRIGLTADMIRLGAILASLAIVGYLVLYFVTHV